MKGYYGFVLWFGTLYGIEISTRSKGQTSVNLTKTFWGLLKLERTQNSKSSKGT
jgi:hypothetical protein